MKQHLKNTFLLLPIAASLPVQAQEKSESPISFLSWPTNGEETL